MCNDRQMSGAIADNLYIDAVLHEHSDQNTNVQERVSPSDVHLKSSYITACDWFDWAFHCLVLYATNAV